MNDRDLIILKYLAQYKNITKTAEALFIAQPALTKRIKHLEDELGAQLVVSSNKGIYFTETGLAAVRYAEEAYNRLTEFKNQIQEIEDRNFGCIKLIAPNIISQYYLPMAIKSFKEFHPQVKFDITMAPSSQVVKSMAGDLYHFGFLRNDFGWDEESHLLGVDYIAVVSMSRFELKNLEQMSRVAYHTDAYYARMLDFWWKDNFDSLPKIDIMTNSLDICKEMVYRGLGFGILPSVFLPEVPNAYTHILKGKDGNPIERRTRIIYKKSVLGNPLAREFLDFIKQQDFSKFLQLTMR